MEVKGEQPYNLKVLDIISRTLLSRFGEDESAEFPVSAILNEIGDEKADLEAAEKIFEELSGNQSIIIEEGKEENGSEARHIVVNPDQQNRLFYGMFQMYRKNFDSFSEYIMGEFGNQTGASESLRGDINDNVQRIEEEYKKADEELYRRLSSEMGKKMDDHIDRELELTGKIGGAMNSLQKEIIQYMAIFVAIFSILGINAASAGGKTVGELFAINLLLVSSISVLCTILRVFTSDNIEDLAKRVRVVVTLIVGLMVGVGVLLYFLKII